MTKRAFYLVICGLLLVTCCKQRNKPQTNEPVKVSGKQVYQDSSSSMVKVFDQNGRVCIQQTSTYYEMVDAYEGTNKIPLLLKITRTDLCYADSVNKDKVYQISAQSVMDTKPINWQAQVVATDLQLKDKTNTILAIHEGTGEEEDLITRFSLLDGKEVFTASYSDMKVSIPNLRERRFAGYTSRNAVTAPVQKGGGENALAFINYSSSSQLISRAVLKLKRTNVAGKIPNYTPEMTFVSANDYGSVIEDGKGLVMMKLDENYKPADIKDFSIQFTIYYGDDNESTKITIPVINDKLDIQHAQYDKDIFELNEVQTGKVQ